jgi:hypothetical protein
LSALSISSKPVLAQLISTYFIVALKGVDARTYAATVRIGHRGINL